jgi:hypothetical protein
MFRPFLFIGVGGSGGKTLRTLRADLLQRLAEVGYEGDWPSCWRLIHIDVPTTPDGLAGSGASRLEEKDYFGLVGRNINYQVVDNTVMQKASGDDARLGTMLGWRPEPTTVTVPVGSGAGQYRAIGRIITVANFGKIKDAVTSAFDSLQRPEVSADLARISKLFNDESSVAVPDVQVVVISSIAGGSGSGAVLDVCDVVRAASGKAAADEMWGLLYAPDVFEHLADDDIPGVQPNALAALSELMNGFWDNEPDQSQFALLEASGIAFGSPGRRGPRFPIMIGRENQSVTFGHQDDVYGAMGKAMAAWTVSHRLQEDMTSYVKGNFAGSINLTDFSGLSLGHHEQPYLSIGFSRMTMGRDNFANYAAERLARSAVERIQRQHLSHLAVGGNQSQQQALSERVVARFSSFLNESGLNERGTDQNQILDALRPENRRDRIEALGASIAGVLTSGFAPTKAKSAIQANVWFGMIVDAIGLERGRFLDEEQVHLNEKVRQWVSSIGEEFKHLTARYIASEGAPVTVELLRRVRSELVIAIDELPQEAAQYNRWGQQVSEMVAEVLQPSATGLQPDNPMIPGAVARGLDGIDHLAEALLRTSAEQIVRDFLTNFLDPLISAVSSGTELLEVEEMSSPNVMDSWPSRQLIPSKFKPAVNEFLLEPCDDYPQIFERQIIRSANADDAGGAELEFIGHSIVGSSPSHPATQSLIDVNTKWVPTVGSDQGALGGSTRAQFVLRTKPEQILGRAMELVTRRTTPIGQFVGESLQDFLDPAKADAAEIERRAQMFKQKFVQAMMTAEPLIKINPSALSSIHDKQQSSVNFAFTEIPFSEGSRGYSIIKEVIEAQDGGEDIWNVASRSFSEGKQSRIDVFAVLGSSYNPLVFESITKPIANEWAKKSVSADQREAFWRHRRARPLPYAFPGSPFVRQAMLRGWFTALLFGDLKAAKQARETKVSLWTNMHDGYADFPFPLLGAQPSSSGDRVLAVFESLPIAMIDFATRGSGLEPYARLRSLGTSMEGTDRAYTKLNEELADWIESGTRIAGAPIPDPNVSGVATDENGEQRKAKCLLSIDKWLEEYSMKVPLHQSDLGGARHLEMSDVITKALGELRLRVVNATTKIEGGW